MGGKLESWGGRINYRGDFESPGGILKPHSPLDFKIPPGFSRK
eukprot:UN02291